MRSPDVGFGDADPRPPAVPPLFGSMNGLPPLLLQVGNAELLLTDTESAASAAAAAGVDVRSWLDGFLRAPVGAQAKLDGCWEAAREAGRGRRD